MIAFNLKSKDGKNILGLGFSDQNIENLKQGKPIMKEVSSYVQGNIDQIFIMYGATEFAMMNDLKKIGAISENTQIHSDGFLR